MKQTSHLIARVLNFLLIITSLLGYLEWAGSNSVFLAEAEWVILQHLFSSPETVIHPFTLIPLAGQLILLFTLFQDRPSPFLTYSGIALIFVLLGFMLFIGLMALNYKIILSVSPFIALAISTILYRRRQARRR